MNELCGPLDSSFRLAVPRCWGSKQDADTKDTLILMEDLRHSGYAMKDISVDPISKEELECIFFHHSALAAASLAYQTRKKVNISIALL